MSDQPGAPESGFWADASGERALDRYSTLVNMVDDGIYQLDAEGRFVAVNDTIVELSGYSREELLGEHVSLVLADEEVNCIQSEINRRLTDDGRRDESIEFTACTADGDTIPCELELHLLVEDSTLKGSMGVVRDITEQKERERQFQENQNKLRTLIDDVLDTSDVGTFILDSNFEVVWVNQATERYFGLDREAVIGRDKRRLIEEEIASIIEAPDRFTERVTATYDDNTYTEEFECHVLGDDAREERWLNHWSQPIESGLYAGGRIEHYTDITDQIKYKHELEESNERLEEFAYAASHDLQEPLRMVTSYLNLIEDRYADQLDEDGEEFVEFAMDGAKRMREMIEGLLQYSRVETQGDSFEPVDLDDVLSDVRNDLQMKIENSDAEITVGDLPSVKGDTGQLRQVFQNIVDNAVKYSGDEPPRIDIAAERDGAEWIVSISDEGIGIDQDHAAGVFEVFQRRHTQDEQAGTGIGLALCERIVERHGGEIWVDSEPGEGATFSFTLPATDS